MRLVCLVGVGWSQELRLNFWKISYGKHCGLIDPLVNGERSVRMLRKSLKDRNVQNIIRQDAVSVSICHP